MSVLATLVKKDKALAMPEVRSTDRVQWAFRDYSPWEGGGLFLANQHQLAGACLLGVKPWPPHSLLLSALTSGGLSQTLTP